MLFFLDHIDFYIDDNLIGSVQPNMSFWEFGEFSSTGLGNPWRYAEPNAPFDQEVIGIFLLISLK